MPHTLASRWSSCRRLCRICSASSSCFVHPCSRLSTTSSVVSSSSRNSFSSSNYASAPRDSPTVAFASSSSAPASSTRVSTFPGAYSFACRRVCHASSSFPLRNSTRARYASRRHANATSFHTRTCVAIESFRPSSTLRRIRAASPLSPFSAYSWHANIMSSTA